MSTEPETPDETPDEGGDEPEEEDAEGEQDTGPKFEGDPNTYPDPEKPLRSP